MALPTKACFPKCGEAKDGRTDIANRELFFSKIARNKKAEELTVGHNN